MIRKLDVCHIADAEFGEAAPYVLVLQSHQLAALDTVVVAPLFKPDIIKPNSAVAIAVHVNNEPYTLDLALIGACTGAR